MLERFSSVGDMIRANQPEESVYCICDGAIRDNARRFQTRFSGTVLYALKANPMKEVTDVLYDAGIEHFDTASLPEISMIAERYPRATTYFMHPVKGWSAIREAYDQYGVRHFVVDHADEVRKMDEVLGQEKARPVLVVRLSTPSKDATFNLSEKFGARPEEAVELMRDAFGRGFPVGLCFHVGSQCLTTDGYEAAFDLTAQVLAKSNIPIQCLDVGGGFPASYETVSPPSLETFLEVISTRVDALNLPPECHVMCEPGRALVANAMSVVTQVQLRRDSTLYITDGIYGTLGGSRLGLHFPVRAYTVDGELASENQAAFTVFGPTCDSLDVLPYKLSLPTAITSGEWIEFGMQGAYGPATRTDFNGFMPHRYCYVDQPFEP